MFNIPEPNQQFVHIGNVLTNFEPYDFDEIMVREFNVSELKLIHLSMHSRSKPMLHLLRAIQFCCSVDVTKLTDGDFEFVMAYIRKMSYPSAPLLVHWECNKHNVIKSSDRTFYHGPELTEREMLLQGYEIERCGSKNVEIVNKHRQEIILLDDENYTVKEEGVDFAYVGTLIDCLEHIEEHPEDELLAKCARWVEAGTTFAEKFEILTTQTDLDLYERIVCCMKKYEHGIKSVMNLRCRECDDRWSHTTRPDWGSFFADNSEDDIYRILYTLASEFGVNFNPDSPSKLLLHQYSSLAKDKQEAAQKAAGSLG